MKKLISFLLIICAVVTISSCTKNSSGGSGGDYYMKFKRDGSQVNMPYSPQAIFTDISSSGLYNASLEAFTSDGKTAMILMIYDNTPIVAGKTYTQAYVSSSLVIPQAQLAYTDETTTGYSSGSATLNADANAVVTISELTNDHIKGTFSGKLLTSDYTGFKYTITDGEFNLSIK